MLLHGLVSSVLSVGGIGASIYHAYVVMGHGSIPNYAPSSDGRRVKTKVAKI